MGIFASPRQRSPYVAPIDRGGNAEDGARSGAGTLLGGVPPAANDWIGALARQRQGSSDGDANGVVRVSDGPTAPDENVEIAQQLPTQQRLGRDGVPNVEPPPGTALKDGPGQPVVLPDGSRVADRYSSTGQLMSPVADLSDVAAAGRDATESSRVLRSHPSTFEAGMLHYGARFGFALGHGGAFDYQREPGNSITGFEQLPQFRNVSNVNVGLFGQQAGWSLDEVLRQAGEFAKLKSGNWRSDQPYGLDTQTREFIELGHKIGASGVYGHAASR
ncbi:MAG: hypothetical protein ACHQK9_16340 [Reyranellales bacterium]